MCGTQGDGRSADTRPCQGQLAPHTRGVRAEAGGRGRAGARAGDACHCGRRVCVHAVGWRCGERLAGPSQTRERPAPRPRPCGSPEDQAAGRGPSTAVQTRSGQAGWGAGRGPLRLRVLVCAKVGDPPVTGTDPRVTCCCDKQSHLGHQTARGSPTTTHFTPPVILGLRFPSR